MLVIISFVSTLWLSVFWLGRSRGKEYGEFTINQFKTRGCFKGDYNINTCFKIIDENGNTLHEGLLLSIDEENIAIFTKEGLFLLPRKENFMLQRKIN